MSALGAIWNAFVALAANTDIAMLIAAVLIILAAGLLVRRATALGTATLAGLAAFGFANYAQGVALKGENAVAAAGADWQKLTDMHGNDMIAYLLAFLVLTTIVFLVRAIIFQR